MSPDFLSGLNEQQLEAVTLPHQSALILAGAGSGKTRVLTTRVAWLIQTGQVSPQGLIAVTFTNKAAKEMLTRISAMLPINTRGMWVGTFHGLANRMLRAHHREAGLPQLFQILDTQDQQAVIKRLLKSLDVDEDRFPPRQVQWFVAANKEEGLRAPQVEARDDYTRRMRDLYAAYDGQCNREGVVDFAELLLRSYELLAANDVLRAHYGARFRHVLVDEFQDTNRLQYRWLKLLARTTPAAGAATPPTTPAAVATPGPDALHRVGSAPAPSMLGEFPAQPRAGGESGVIFAVGDDDQSIYAFRGASSANMQDLRQDFGIERVIKLEQNYRSHGHILDAANALIGHNRRRLGKNLWTAEGKGEPLRVFEAATDIEEAGFIVDEAKALRGEGVALAQIAVLYRSNAQSRVLEHALFNAGMAYRVYGGLRFFERQEVKHALAYLRLLANPEDDGAFARIANFPARGIGNRSLEQLQDAAKERGTSLWAAAKRRAEGGGRRDEEKKREPGDPSSLIPHPSSLKGIPGFVALIERMREATKGLPLPEAIEHVIEASGLKGHYRAEKEGADRLENLAELVNAAAAFVAERDVRPAGEAAGLDEPDELSAFLAHAALEAGEHQADAGADALQLMTAHSAKGLEFHSVFVSGLEEGLFPHENSLTEADGIEEERRLMYVALTRARRRLYLSYSQSRLLHGQTRYGIASRFFQEIPEGLMRRIAPRYGIRGTGYRKGGSPPSLDPRPSTLVPDSPWRVGQSVVHPTFGAGVIVNAEGRGPDARVQVNFRKGGLKWLMLEYARLIPA
jgi:DNA helicase-2/ATP-dependent DNA helicase PcrA